METKIIFLDVDGVLNRRVLGEPQICPECCRNLNDILEATGAMVVVSSSWRYQILRGDHTNESWAKQFHDHGAERLTVIDTIDADRGHYTRGKLIRLWLALKRGEFGVRQYCVIDDEDYDIGTYHVTRFIQTDPRVGLTASDAARAIQILNGTSQA